MASKRALNGQHLWLLGLTALAGVLLYLLGPILSSFLFAAILAYICHPLADRMEASKIPRTLAVVLIMLLLAGLVTALFLVLLPLVIKESALLAERLPDALDWLKMKVAPWLSVKLGVEVNLDIEQLKTLLSAHWQTAGDVAAKLLPSLTSGGRAVVGWLVNLVLVPVVFFYLLRDWDAFVAQIGELIPRRWHGKVTQIASQVDSVLAEFLRGQLTVMLVMAVYYSFALWLTGLEFALAIGALTGLLVFVPYLGVVVGLTLATLAGGLQFQSISGLAPVWIALGVGQMLEGTLVTPWLVGERIGLHPLAVIFALLAFGQLFGFFGVLLALPASAALLVGLRHVRERYVNSEVYKSS
jgi:predicted PurR-regulated permease PerM